MSSNMRKTILLIVFLILGFLFYLLPDFDLEYYQVFLTIASFLFAIFAGFYISRQGTRYSNIRDQITKFDGEMSAIFRQFGHLSITSQKQVKKIISKHYNKILKEKSWDYHFINKSTTITDIHNLVHKYAPNKPLPSLKHLALQRVLTALENLQVIRKNMIALHQERIPPFQWVVIILLSLILLISLSLIPSQYNFSLDILKSFFGTIVIGVIILLYEFDNLRFFEGTIGQSSAEDILEIFKGKK